MSEIEKINEELLELKEEVDRLIIRVNDINKESVKIDDMNEWINELSNREVKIIRR